MKKSKNLIENFAKFTGKHLCWSLYFNKVAETPPVTASGLLPEITGIVTNL